MPRILRLFILIIFLSFYSLVAYAADPPGERPEFIPIIKKPCYLGCDYVFQFCYYYNISNMDNAIKVTEWNADDNFITGKAVADIKAKLLIKMCYQVSLTSAYAVVDQDLNFKSEFEFKIKLKGDIKEQCIEFEEGAITYSTFELTGDVKTDPIPVMRGQLSQDIAEIIHDSVSKTVYKSLPANIRSKKVYCSEEHNKTYEENYPCRCD